jgi:hypothetical protein
LDNSAIVGDFVAIERDVEIRPHEHAFALHIHIRHGFAGHWFSLEKSRDGCYGANWASQGIAMRLATMEMIANNSA